MEARIKEVLIECTKGSDEGRLTFPEVIQALAQAGVERYYADLQRAEKIYYLPSGVSLAVPAHRIDATPAIAFDGAGVDGALRKIQAKQTTYIEFCEQIARAGCIGYVVSLAGRRAVYLGRTGESYVELFPGSK